MGKGKGRKAKATRSYSEPVAQRHDFDVSGQLGHATGEYSTNVTELTALSVDVVFACVTTIADLVADAAIGEYRGTEQLIPSRIVLRPMASVSRRTWVKQVAATMALYNGCYLRVMGGYDSEGAPYSMVPVSPSRLTWPRADDPHIDGQRIPLRDLRYIPRAVFPTASPDLATILRLARDAIGAAWAASSYAADFWEAGGTPVVQISTDQAISGPDADAIADRWVEKRQSGPGRPAVMGKGAKASLLGADVSTEGAATAGDRLGSSIARYFRVPPWLVNVPTVAGSMVYANSGAAGLDLARYTLRPGYAGPIEDGWSDALPGSYITGRRVVMDLAHLTLGTVLEQAQAYQIATGQRPWMLPSEVRTRLHMPMDTTLDEQGAPAPAMEAIA